MIPSFGGWSADQGGTEIGDSCKNVNSIFDGLRVVVTTYDVTRLDMDIEGRSLTKTDGIDRRNKAIKLLQDWATREWPAADDLVHAADLRALASRPSGLAVLQNAIANGVRIYIVQPMVFDYYDRVTTDMGAAAVNAVTGLHAQLATLLPGKTDAAALGDGGRDDHERHRRLPEEDRGHDLADAQQLLDFAQPNGMAVLSMWAIQRDNGNCPGVGGANDCSGIAQSTWAFSGVFAPFTAP